jgi:hypothetical protein
MLNFLISSIAFSLAAYVLNSYLHAKNIVSTQSHSLVVMLLATIISIGVGWATDQLDGEAELHKNDPTFNEIVKSGDPVKLVKLLIGFN